jgi:hypothetical protein
MSDVRRTSARVLYPHRAAETWHQTAQRLRNLHCAVAVTCTHTISEAVVHCNECGVVASSKVLKRSTQRFDEDLITSHLFSCRNVFEGICDVKIGKWGIGYAENIEVALRLRFT